MGLVLNEMYYKETLSPVHVIWHVTWLELWLIS